jgi:hypothetical protein
VSSIPFAVTGAVNCCIFIANARMRVFSPGLASSGASASSMRRTNSKMVVSAARLRRRACATAHSM